MRAGQIYLGLMENGNALNSTPMVSRSRSLAGSLIGRLAETKEILDFRSQYGIILKIELIDIRDINAAQPSCLVGEQVRTPENTILPGGGQPTP